MIIMNMENTTKTVIGVLLDSFRFVAGSELSSEAPFLCIKKCKEQLTKWFKHDTTALHDAKIEKLIMKFGIQGYGLYFACVEIIAGNLTNENITFELEHDAEILAYKFKLDTLLVEEMMKYMCTLGLFETKNKKIYCHKLATRIDSSLMKNPDLINIKKKIREDSRSTKKKKENSSQIRSDKIRVDKNINNIKKPVKDIVIKDSLHHKIQLSFEAINGVFDDYAVEGKAIKGLITKAKRNNPDNPELFIRNMANTFKILRDTDTKNYWSTMPFLPSRLNSNGVWTGVKQVMENKKSDIDKLNKLDKICEGIF